MWTQFWDTHSGGDTKEGKLEQIFIEAPEKEAKIIFYNRFGHNPDRVTCTCCGSDYSINEGEFLDKLTHFHRRIWERNSDKEEYQTPEEFSVRDDVLIIYDKDIKREERSGEVPEEGYIWVG